MEEIGFKSVTADEPLYTSNLIDSMGTVDLAMMLLEEEFKIKNDTEILFRNFDSINKIRSLLKAD